jgi:hypothetical protein
MRELVVISASAARRSAPDVVNASEAKYAKFCRGRCGIASSRAPLAMTLLLETNQGRQAKFSQ